MDPITIGRSLLLSGGSPTSAFAHLLGGTATGMTAGSGGVTPFSLVTGNAFDPKLSLEGKVFSLQSDLISKVAGGSSMSVFDGLQRVGFIGSNPITGNVSVGGGLNTQMGSQLGSILKATGQL